MQIRVENIVKSYKQKKVVNNASLSIRSGEIVGLLGTNGAGKTTTFYITVGLIRPDQGHIFLNEEEITTLPMYKRARLGIGYLPQESSIFKRMTVEENILCVLETQKLNREKRFERLEELLASLKITHIRKNKGYALSGGERKRAEIARALVMEPKFILFDEPFAGVDPITVGDIQELLVGLSEKGIGILISDHNVRETFSINKRAYIMNQGEILAAGTSEQLLENTMVRQTYLGQDFRF